MKTFSLILLLLFPFLIFAQPDTTFNQTNSDAIICHPLEIAPTLIGGIDSLYTRLNYPAEALKNEIQGKVLIQLVVDTLGNPTNIEVFKGLGFGCDEEAVRVVRNSKFTPGYQRGKLVNTRLMIPIIFRYKLK